MKIAKQKILIATGVILSLSFTLTLSLTSPPVHADPPTTEVKCKDGKKVTAKKDDAKPNDLLDDKDFEKACEKHKGYEAPKNNTPDTPSQTAGVTHNSSDCSANSTADLDSGNCGIINWIVKITDALAALAGTVIVAMIIWGGIQYSMAGADPSKVQAAKKKIVSALTALLLLVFGFSIVQWLVPGGLF